MGKADLAEAERPQPQAFRFVARLAAGGLQRGGRQRHAVEQQEFRHPVAGGVVLLRSELFAEMDQVSVRQGRLGGGALLELVRLVARELAAVEVLQLSDRR